MELRKSRRYTNLRELLNDHERHPAGNPKVNITGNAYGRLTVLGNPRSYQGASTKIFWVTECECGDYKIANGTKLRRNEIRSCGCLEQENRAKDGRTKKYPREYASWAAMKHRCDSPYTNGYEHYGGAGVTYCDEWRDFETFVKDMGERPEDTSLDRYHPDWKPGDKPLNYGPTTCRWATDKQQNSNLSSNRNITLDGITMPLAVWARKLGCSRSGLAGRIKRGWTEREILQGSRPNPRWVNCERRTAK